MKQAGCSSPVDQLAWRWTEEREGERGIRGELEHGAVSAEGQDLDLLQTSSRCN